MLFLLNKFIQYHLSGFVSLVFYSGRYHFKKYLLNGNFLLTYLFISFLSVLFGSEKGSYPARLAHEVSRLVNKSGQSWFNVKKGYIFQMEGVRFKGKGPLNSVVFNGFGTNRKRGKISLVPCNI